MAVAGAASLLVSSAGSAAPAPRQSEALAPDLGGGSPEGGPESASASATSDPDAILEAIAILGFGTMGEFAGWVASATDVQIDAAIAFIQQYATQEAGQ
jgi:hypothetical protein